MQLCQLSQLTCLVAVCMLAALLSTPRQYLDIIDRGMGRWCTYRKGDTIQAKGEEMSQVHAHAEGLSLAWLFWPDISRQAILLASISPPMIAQMSVWYTLSNRSCHSCVWQLHVLLEGAAECTDANATRQHTPGKGGWLGELFDPNRTDDYWNAPHPASSSIECASEKCVTLAFDRKALDMTLRANPRLAEAATRAELADLWGKLHKAGPERKRRTLASILETALCDGDLHPTEKDQIERFCRKYTITDAELATELKQLGWSMDDYARGRKK